MSARPTDFLAEALRQRGAPLSLAAGQALFSEGQRDGRVFLLETGSIDIGIHSREGQRLTLNVLRAGAVFGEVAMLDGGPRTADALARVDSRVTSLDRRRFFALFSSKEEAYEYVVQLLCRRLRWTNRHSEHGPLCTASALLASRLLMLREGESADWIAVNQQALADMAGIAREYVNRLLGEWANAGVVERRRGAVRVVRPEALVALSGVGN